MKEQKKMSFGGIYKLGSHHYHGLVEAWFGELYRNVWEVKAVGVG